MVYCTKCGTKNEKEAEYCTKCGAKLDVSREKRLERRAEEWGEDLGRRAEEWGEQFGKRMEDECFGLPHGGAIVGIVIGIMIIIIAISLIPGLIPTEVRQVTDPLFWPVIVIVFGVLIIAGALYKYARG